MTALLVAAAAGTAAAQERRPMTIEGTVGWAGFVDDATIEHTVFGGALLVPLTPRTSVGPEFMYMAGPGSDRDRFVIGSIWFDALTPRAGTYVTPYLVAGAGYMRHTDEFSGRSFSSGEGAFSAGGGVRAYLGDRVYAGADVRVGWELHLRAAAHVGIRLR
jgi:hypothetical protein